MKLITLLQSLRPDEHRDFEKFLQSPFFKPSDMYLRFFREIRKRSETFELDKDQLHAAYRRCFGKNSLNDTKWYNLASGLSKQIEQFLVVQLVAAPAETNDNPLFNQLLVKAMHLRNMGTAFRATADKTIHKVLNSSQMKAEDYLALMQFHHSVYFNPDTQRFGADAAHLQSASAYLDHYYCLEKLRYTAEFKARERILNVQYDIPMLDAVLAFSKDPGLEDDHPLWAIYRDLVLLYSGDADEQGYKHLSMTFFKRFSRLTRSDQTAISRYLINIGISLAARFEGVEPELFNLYKLVIDEGLLLDENRITHLSFINIANLAGVCREFEWGRRFIADYAPFLEENKRRLTVDLAMAGIYYNEGFPDKARSCLTPDTFSIAPFDLLSRVLLLKIVFDAYWLKGDDYDFLTSQAEGFIRFVRHKNLTKDKKNAYLNWVRFLKKMTAARNKKVGNVSKQVKDQLLKNLNSIPSITSRNWTAAKLKS